jgi:hypothetical protein
LFTLDIVDERAKSTSKIQKETSFASRNESAMLARNRCIGHFNITLRTTPKQQILLWFKPEAFKVWSDDRLKPKSLN